jgi:prostaglandin-E synthase 1
MTTLLADPQFKLYAVCCCILSFQMLLLAAMTAAKRNTVKNYLNPEDVKVAFAGAKQVEGEEHPDVARVIRAHRNMNESVALFFALGLISVLAGISPLGARICFGVFTGARILHSIVYIKGVQPFRTMFYAFGSFALLGMMAQILIAVLA